MWNGFVTGGVSISPKKNQPDNKIDPLKEKNPYIPIKGINYRVQRTVGGHFDTWALDDPQRDDVKCFLPKRGSNTAVKSAVDR